jgi:hypothetical protein
MNHNTPLAKIQAAKLPTRMERAKGLLRKNGAQQSAVSVTPPDIMEEHHAPQPLLLFRVSGQCLFLFLSSLSHSLTFRFTGTRPAHSLSLSGAHSRSAADSRSSNSDRCCCCCCCCCCCWSRSPSSWLVLKSFPLIRCPVLLLPRVTHRISSHLIIIVSFSHFRSVKPKGSRFIRSRRLSIRPSRSA